MKMFVKEEKVKNLEGNEEVMLTPSPYPREGFAETTLREFAKRRLEVGHSLLPEYDQDLWGKTAWVLPTGETLYPLIAAAKALMEASAPARQSGSYHTAEEKGMAYDATHAAMYLIWELRDRWCKEHQVRELNFKAATRYLREGNKLWYDHSK